jgi:hypothetical protein
LNALDPAPTERTFVKGRTDSPLKRAREAAQALAAAFLMCSRPQGRDSANSIVANREALPPLNAPEESTLLGFRVVESRLKVLPGLNPSRELSGVSRIHILEA